MFVAVTVMLIVPALLKMTSGDVGLPVGGWATGRPATLVTARVGCVPAAAVAIGAEVVLLVLPEVLPVCSRVRK